ncbi:MAG: DUF2235 domain-containing protein [Gammaproteobacteria bacterium]|nr:DUF2235 domain-containing protein [Gammaproteobacteria bacterium]
MKQEKGRNPYRIMFVWLIVACIVGSALANASENTKAKKIVVCLDGTWNNPATKKETSEWKDKVYKPTNVVKTCRSVIGTPRAGASQITYYDIGVGGLRKYSGGWNTTHRIVDNVFGGARGAGYEGNVEDAYRFLLQNYNSGDEIYIFGFSRGAATARTLTQYIDWSGGLLAKDCAYWLPRFFDTFLQHKSSRSWVDEKKAIRSDTRESELHKKPYLASDEDRLKESVDQILCVKDGKDQMIRPVEISYLGLWDTVLSLGRRKDKFYVKPVPEKNIKSIRQALGIDESRFDFKPHIYHHPNKSKPSQNLQQRWFAGVHSNIGGGYVDDGLANHALYWVLEGAMAGNKGLQLRPEFLNFYRPYAQDRLYNSRKWYWSVAEALRFRYKKGVRRIDPRSINMQSANLAVHPSAIERLGSCRQEPYLGKNGEKRIKKHYPLDSLYRPKNLLRYLSALDALGDLEAYLIRMFPDVQSDGVDAYALKYVSPKTMRDRVIKIVSDPKRSDFCPPSTDS